MHSQTWICQAQELPSTHEEDKSTKKRGKAEKHSSGGKKSISMLFFFFLEALCNCKLNIWAYFTGKLINEKMF